MGTSSFGFLGLMGERSSAKADGGEESDKAHLTPTTPSTTRFSPVMVPVLSKQQMSTRPAKGMRKGSVQKIAAESSRSASLIGAEGTVARTELGQGDEGSVDGHREFHGELGRDDRGDDDDTVEEELGALAVLLDTYYQKASAIDLAESERCRQAHP